MMLLNADGNKGISIQPEKSCSNMSFYREFSGFFCFFNKSRMLRNILGVNFQCLVHSVIIKNVLTTISWYHKTC